MKKTYSILVVTDELLTCPAVQQYSELYDLLLTTNHRHVVRLTLKKQRQKDVCGLFVNFDAERINVETSTILMPDKRSAYFTVVLCVIPKEVGETSISFSRSINGKNVFPIYQSKVIGSLVTSV